MNRRSVLAMLLAGGGAGALALAGCTPLTAFNALVPKDRGIIRVIEDAPFGPDPRQRLDIYRPISPARDLPIIVFFYGGSWNSGTRAGYAWVARALAARGFVVAVPDYRLVPEVRFPTFIEDGAAAVRLVSTIAESIGGDPDRIILAGHSAGAYNAAMLAYDERFLGRDRARVKGFIGLAGPYDFLPLDGPATRAAFERSPNLAATQPINVIDRADPPAFIGSANDDRTVREKNSNSLAARLLAAGVRVERVRYPGLGHIGILTAVAKPWRGRASVLDDVTRFALEASQKPPGI
ncbi:MAG: alpha/beta hydrolase [Sphingomicrobium sp.]